MTATLHILADAAAADSNSGNLLGWIIVYTPLLLICAFLFRFANRRNRLIREQLTRIESKLDTLLSQQ